jgi:hypothetical protein
MNRALTVGEGCRAAGFWDARKRHRLWIGLMVAFAALLAVVLTVYGWDYYTLDQGQRPFSAKHADLKPSGKIGLRLGFLGLFLFAMVYLYPLRKRWYALGRIGKTTNWLDYHITLGLIAPVVISFHSSFKIHGFAGMAYWTMLALTVSGLIGRYFYAQIPRSLGAAEMSLKEMQSLSAELLEGLNSQKMLSVSELSRLFRLPDSNEVQSMPILRMLIRMARLDLARPWKLWALRRRQIGFGRSIFTLGGVLRTRNAELERAITLARRQASLAKRILFLSKTQHVFHLWHVIHRPFSLSFAIFVLIHVAVVMWLGYF